MIEPHSITCEDCQDRLEEFALDELEGDVRDQVTQHLRGGCRACNTQLAQIAADLATVAHALPTQAPPREIEQDLLRRIAKAPVVTLPPESTLKRSLSRTFIAAAIGLAACLALIAAWNTWNGALTGLSTEEWADLRRRADEAERAQRFDDVPQLTFASLRGPAPEKPVYGYVVADHVTHQWHVYVFNLPALPEDRTYQLWFAAADKPTIPSLTVRPDTDGTVSEVIDLPSDVPDITGLAISDEPLTGSLTPTGDHIYQADLP